MTRTRARTRNPPTHWVMKADVGKIRSGATAVGQNSASHFSARFSVWSSEKAPLLATSHLPAKEMASPKQLFKYCLDESRTSEQTKRLFFYRLNRWRFDPYDTPRAWKSGSRGVSSFHKFRYAFGLFVIYRLTLHCKFYVDVLPETH